MEVHHHFDLKRYNTFGIQATAEYFAEFSDVDALKELISYSCDKSIMILGGGSNILITHDISGQVLHNRMVGISVVDETENHVYVCAEAGTVWHDLVMYCVNKGWGGIENLSLIPGTVGAAPIQNIGAYGAELKDSFFELEALHLSDLQIHRFDAKGCLFGYRDSIFKRACKGKYVILNVTLRLAKNPVPNTSYHSLHKELAALRLPSVTIKDVSETVIRIRRSKLPDPKQIGNAGSFFKNPVVEKGKFLFLLKDFPKMPHYDMGDKVKIPAAWLIEQMGFKGYRQGDAGCHVDQPLVLVNYGNATGKQILNLSESIIRKVKQSFDIALEREVNVI
ncbi:MAG TPA: UDP-N-acetylmuramate dehydrogenase [Ginsengibacter sp.]|nr:UDP-N-acetylmuramate dehydrogenase [Ginsengibacter sp.]HRP45555.1 UDP-N-acetylmuramate dehydrogenase [Ginsengibacter sp.]